MARPRVTLRDAKQKFRDNRDRALRLGNDWTLTFEQWYNWWLEQGVDKNLSGEKYSKHSLILVRIDLTKPYAIDNITAMTRGVTNTGRPCRSLGKERPHTWIIKDPALHKMYIPFLKAKSQTDYRVREGIAEGEWKLSFEEFVAAWGDLWQLRGRASEDFAMTREDFDGDWTADNVVVVTRKEQLERARQYRASQR
jgi:hypothetical protein